MGVQGRIATEVALLPSDISVLVIEDQPLVAATARDMIETLGGAIAAFARTVDEALDACRTATFDLALLDLDLEGVSSAPVAELLARRRTPFLIVTGSDRLPAGFGKRPFLVKPYTLRALRDGLMAMLA